MTRYSNGMMGCQAVEKHTMTIYDFYFAEGKLKKLHCYSYYNSETKFEDVYNPFKHQFILKEHFEEAFEIFCNTENCDEIISFLEYLENDIQLKPIAKEIIRKCNYKMAKQAQELAKAVWQVEKLK